MKPELYELNSLWREELMLLQQLQWIKKNGEARQKAPSRSYNQKRKPALKPKDSKSYARDLSLWDANPNLKLWLSQMSERKVRRGLDVQQG